MTIQYRSVAGQPKLTITSHPYGDSIDDAVFVRDYQIKDFDWDSQSFDVPAGLKLKLHRELMKRNLENGIPFDFCVDGEPIYTGMFVTSLSYQSFTGPVINLFLRNPRDRTMTIENAYPNDKIKDNSPNQKNYNERIRQALEQSNRLK